MKRMPRRNSQALDKNSKTPLVSIILLSFLREAQTRACLAAVREFTSLPYEILIVDMGGSPALQAWLQALQQECADIKVLFNETNTGTARGRNLAAACARGRYLVFLDNDACVLPGWLEPLVAGVSDAAACGAKILSGDGRRVECCGARISVEYKEDQINALGLEIVQVLDPDDPAAMQAGPVVWYPTTCLLIRKDVFGQIGGFDENLFICEEDKDLALKLRRSGHLIYYAPDSQIRHSHPPDAEEYRRVRRDKALLFKDQKYFSEKWNCGVFYRKSRKVFLSEGLSDAYVDDLKRNNPLYTIMES